MDSNEIVRNVYDGLKGGVDCVAGMKSQISILDGKIDSGVYSPELVKGFREKKAELSKNIRMELDSAIKRANEAVEQYSLDVEKRYNTMDPKELTDDIRLLQTGVPLKQSDLHDILDRSEGNVTMRNLVLRYAKQNGIEVSGKYKQDGQAEKNRAKTLFGLISYYSRWIGEPQARKMLDVFFRECFPNFFDEE